MPHRHRTAVRAVFRALASLAVAAPLAAAALAAQPGTALGDGGLTMTAHAQLHGRVRVGSWYGIAVDISNAGPAVTGELRVLGGSDGRTSFSQAAELATGSRKEFVLFAQPPAFLSSNPTVDLVADGKVVASAKVDIAPGDAGSLAVGVLADNPAKLIGEISLLPSASGSTPVIVPLTAADLPERVQAWAPLDRLVWQDVDGSTLSKGQLGALSAWVAGGGQLLVVGGTSGPASLAALPDDLLPYRPTSTLDVDPAVLRTLIGGVPDASAPLPALAGTLARGRSLASSGGQAIAADMPYGAGTVTLLGFDPTTPWLAKGDTWDAPLWRRLLGSGGGAAAPLTDDSMMVSTAANLPSVALPATGGLLALLIAYIVLIGPVNYVVLRVLDRREWAWVTVPVLIAAFTAGAFGIGVLTRGSDVVLHQVAIVRGAPGTDRATAQAWTAVFSPGRTSFQVSAAGDTLLSPPLAGDSMTGQASGQLDIVEGDPTRIRDLAVGYSSVRTVRAEGSTKGLLVDTDLHLEGTVIKGSVTNRSAVAISGAVLVLGSSVDHIGDIAAGTSAEVRLDGTAFDPNMGGSLADNVVGMMLWDGGNNANVQRLAVRHSIIDQLANNSMNWGMGVPAPMAGAAGGPAIVQAFPGPMGTSSLGTVPMLLAWGTEPALPLDIEGAQPRQTADVLYQIPVRVAVTGHVRFTRDLLPWTMTSTTGPTFSKDPTTMWMDTGAMTVSYRPIPFAGTLEPSAVTIAMNHPGDMVFPSARPVDAPIGGRCVEGGSACSTTSTFPDVDVFDVRAGAWVELGGLNVGSAYTLPDAGRWVNPATGEVQVRFTNQSRQQLAFQFLVAVEGSVQ